MAALAIVWPVFPLAEDVNFHDAEEQYLFSEASRVNFPNGYLMPIYVQQKVPYAPQGNARIYYQRDGERSLPYFIVTGKAFFEFRYIHDLRGNTKVLSYISGGIPGGEYFHYSIDRRDNKGFRGTVFLYHGDKVYPLKVNIDRTTSSTLVSPPPGKTGRPDWELTFIGNEPVRLVATGSLNQKVLRNSFFSVPYFPLEAPDRASQAWLESSRFNKSGQWVLPVDGYMQIGSERYRVLFQYNRNNTLKSISFRHRDFSIVLTKTRRGVLSKTIKDKFIVYEFTERKGFYKAALRSIENLVR